MSGWVRIERDLFASPFFAGQPMSEREAWVWMIARAAWEDTKHRVGGEMLDVPRGSFMATLREMQAAFMWGSDTRVRTFLKRLEDEFMIERTTVGQRNAPKTHVTICNYDEYKSPERTENAPKTHRERTKNAVKEQINNKQGLEPKGSSSPDADFSLHPVDDVSEAVADYNAAARDAGWPEVKVVSPKRRAAISARLKDAGGNEGWRDALARARASPHLCGQNDRGWRADFDFLTTASKFTKLIEGSYDQRKSPRDLPRPSQERQRSDAALDRIIRLSGLGEA